VSLKSRSGFRLKVDASVLSKRQVRMRWEKFLPCPVRAAPPGSLSGQPLRAEKRWLRAENWGRPDPRFPPGPGNALSAADDEENCVPSSSPCDWFARAIYSLILSFTGRLLHLRNQWKRANVLNTTNFESWVSGLSTRVLSRNRAERGQKGQGV